MTVPCSYVIFGATGNLATTKLLPALYHLDQADRLHPDLRIVCCGRRPHDQEEWLEIVREALQGKARGGIDQQLLARIDRAHVGDQHPVIPAFFADRHAVAGTAFRVAGVIVHGQPDVTELDQISV